MSGSDVFWCNVRKGIVKSTLFKHLVLKDALGCISNHEKDVLEEMKKSDVRLKRFAEENHFYISIWIKNTLRDFRIK